jgi:hypothetical protein
VAYEGLEPCDGRLTSTVVCPVMAGVFSRRQSCDGKSQKPCSSDGRVKGTDILKPIDIIIFKDDNELSGRNKSERRGGPEIEKPQRSSPQP